MQELRTIVIYDIVDDRIRTKIAEACFDFGLTRIQYSAFAGRLNRNRREELFLRLTGVLGADYGRILIQPVCDSDIKGTLLHEHERPQGGGQ